MGGVRRTAGVGLPIEAVFSFNCVRITDYVKMIGRNTMNGKRFTIKQESLPVRGWPGILGGISKLMGDEFAEDFAHHFGDKTLHIPRPARLKETNKIAEVFGLNDALILCEHFGGEEYRIPTGKWTLARHKVRVLRTAKWSIDAIAKALGYGKGMVTSHCDDIDTTDGPAEIVEMRCASCGRMTTYDPNEFPQSSNTKNNNTK